ncbi:MULTISPECIES: MFS transporter [Pseudomonas syringae group]|uniref:MFS transporter n=1 Tax=Pseudomonas syringae group TaxID=136849 RepID=UPI0002E1A002|nr:MULTISPECIES: MFS transporter [Pseudomonas syringae group]UZS66455.1 MFS transporter [Pseudomonas syringae]
MHKLSRIIRSPRNHIVAGLFIVSLGTYLVTPLYTVHLVGALGLSAADVGMLLIITTVAQRGLTLPVGIAIDKVDPRWFLFAGLGLRAMSFFALGMADSFALLAIAAALAGSGTAAFQTAGKTVLLELDPDKALSLALRNMSINAGIALGPLAGMLLTHYDFFTTCMITSSLYMMAMVTEAISLRHMKMRALALPNGSYRELFLPLKSTRARFLLFANFCFFGFFSLFELILPLHIKASYPAFYIGVLFALNAIVVVAFQLPVSRMITRHHLAIGHGFSLLLCSIVMFFLSSICSMLWSLPLFFFGVILFSLAEVYLMFIIELRLVTSIGDAPTGTTLGCSSLSAMLGLSAGLLFFGWIYDQWASQQEHFFWMLISLICLVIAFLISSVERWTGKAHRALL